MAKRKVKKPCKFPQCSKVTTAKHGYCPEHKKQVDRDYQKERETHQIYYTKRWKDLRKLVLNNNPLCADPYAHHKRYGEGRAIASEVDHIDGNPDNNEMENLQALCKSCHSRKTALEQDRWGKKPKTYTAPYSRRETRGN
jgi:5-methylcytosine-specific restriction protein A